MANRILAALTAALLAGCNPLFFAKLDERSLTITQTVGPVPGAPQVSVPSASLPPFTFDIGDVGVKQDSADSTLWLNGATLAMLQPPPGTSFAGVTQATLVVVAPSGSTLSDVVVALFDAARDGPATTTLVLKGTGQTNLLPYLEATTFTVRANVSGTPPGPGSWTADLTLDFHVVAQKNLP